MGVKLDNPKYAQCKEWGFDLTDFGREPHRTDANFKRALARGKLTNHSTRPYVIGVNYPTANHFYWCTASEDLCLITANNPLTGVHGYYPERPKEVGYAGSMAVVGKNPSDVLNLVKIVRENSTYKKGESPCKRDFI